MNFNSVNSAKNYLKNGADFILETAVTERDKKLKEIEDKGYSDGIEFGITNTIIALYSANVSDENVIRIMNECWNISEKEIIDRLIHEKKMILIRNLRKYLKLQGMSEKEIRTFFDSNDVSQKIKNNHELWELKDNPEELYTKINGGKI